MTKSLFHILSAVWSLLVWSIPISSCTDDLKSSQTTDRIHFTSAIDNTWTSLATFFRATKIGIWAHGKSTATELSPCAPSATKSCIN